MLNLRAYMVHHQHFIGLSKMTFYWPEQDDIFLAIKLFAQLTLLVLHPVDESTHFQD